MKQTRRQFLQQSASVLALTSLGSFPVWGQENWKNQRSPSDRILVVVQLEGGNDGLNTVIPYREPAYAQNRRILQIPESQILKINTEIGFHPALKQCHQLAIQKKLAVLQGVGYPYPNRSHFRSTEIWQTAKAEEIDTRTGWIGRCADHWAEKGNNRLTACSVGNRVQDLSLVGVKAVPPTIREFNAFQIRKASTEDAGERLKLLEDLSCSTRENPSLEFIRQQTQSAYRSATAVEAVLHQGRFQDYRIDLERKLGLISAMIQAGLGVRIYHVSMSGFDTHSNQKAGHHALLQQLDQSLHTFVQEMQQAKLSQKVAVLVYSEFGRRVQENRSGGTDHGAAAPVLLISDSISQKVYGSHPSLHDLDDGDLKMHTDFRSIYQSLLGEWLQLEPQLILGKRFPSLSLFS
jgi:uncharacterized protein (DUF1501 family)